MQESNDVIGGEEEIEDDDATAWRRGGGGSETCERVARLLKLATTDLFQE